VEPNAPPSREDLGGAAASWAATSLADKLDTLVGLFGAGEQPTGSRDPFGLRRQALGVLRILVDLPELTGANTAVNLSALVDQATALIAPVFDTSQSGAGRGMWKLNLPYLSVFLNERLRFLFEQRGFPLDEIRAVLRPDQENKGYPNPLDLRRRLEALRVIRGSADFEALAVAFKRVKNLARELRPPGAAIPTDRPVEELDRLTEPAELALVQEYRTRGEAVRSAIRSGDYLAAFRLASAFRPAVDRFFTDVFVMVDDAALRQQRLTLLWRLHELLLELADISELVPRTQ
jgi:glycyl-tRNA synthetase beta chain